MYLDLTDGSMVGPAAGDWLVSVGKFGAFGTAYFVISSRRVNRRESIAYPRFQMEVESMEIIDDRFLMALRDGKLQRLRIFEFHWYKRQSRKMTFEQHMRRRA